MNQALCTAGILLAGVAFWGCAGRPTGSPASLPDHYPMPGESVPTQRVIVVNGTEEADAGLHKIAESTDRFVRGLRVRMIEVSDSGFVKAFRPAFPPRDGVEDAPEGVPLAWVEFDAKGRLSGWHAADPEIPQRVMTR